MVLHIMAPPGWFPLLAAICRLWDQSGSPSIFTLLMNTQLGRACSSYARHRNTKTTTYGELPQGQRSRSGQKKRYIDTLKTSLKIFNINHNYSWEVLSAHTYQLRRFVKKLSLPGRASTSYKSTPIKTSTKREGNPCNQS